MDLLTDIKLDIEKTDRNVDRYPDRNIHDICPARYMARGGIKDNPMLLALPYPPSEEQIRKQFRRSVPGYDHDEIATEPIWQKKEGILNLDLAFAPLSVMTHISKAVSDCLYRSYMSRDIKLDLVNTDESPVPCSAVNEYAGSPPFFLVYGQSGCGKTQAMKFIRGEYPRAIRHTLNGFECVQIPIIYVTALNGNLSELLTSIATQVDEILGHGDVWAAKTRHRTVADSCAVVKQLIKRYLIGLIVIDEAQFLPFSGNSSVENLIGIASDTNCAIGMIGNMDLLPKFDKYERLARRSMNGRIEVGCTEEIDQIYFRMAVKFLWQFQWTKKVTPLTDEIVKELCRSSMYNISILKALLMCVQSEFVTRSSDGPITDDDIHQIAEKEFSEVRSLILQGSPEADKKVLEILQKDRDDIMNESKKLEVQAQKRILKKEEKIMDTWGDTKYGKVEKILHEEHGLSRTRIEQVLNKLVKQNPTLPSEDIPFIVSQVLDFLQETQTGSGGSGNSGGKVRRKTLDKEGEELIQGVLAEELKTQTAGVKRESTDE